MFQGIVENSGFVQVVKDGKLYSLSKTKLSKKYARINPVDLPEGTIVKVKGYSVSQFAKKALDDGFYVLGADGLKPCDAPQVDSKTVYLHEIYQEIAEGKGYE